MSFLPPSAIPDPGGSRSSNPAAARVGNVAQLIINGIGFPRLPSFKKGTCPTWLDATEAMKLKAFVENLLFNTMGRLITGSPQTNRAEFIFGPDGNNLELWVQTDLRWDRAPLLNADLDTNRRVIFTDSSDVFLAHGGADGVRIQNKSTLPGLLKLSIGMPGVQAAYIGHKSNAAPDDTIYAWPNDGTNGYVLSTNGSGTLSWVAGGGAPTDASYVVMGNNGSLTQERVLTAGSGISITDGGANSTVTIAATGGGGGMTDWDAGADLGTTATVADGQTLDIAGGTEMSTTGSGSSPGPYTVTVNHVTSGVAGHTYGDSTHVPRIDVNTFGHITSASEVEIDKTAIVPGLDPEEFVELYCTESPEVRFEDVMVIDSHGHQSIMANIDPLFMHVCEPGSIQAIGHTCSKPVAVGIEVIENSVDIELAEPVPMTITVHLSGVRKGRTRKRFGRRTADEAIANDNFWGSWKKRNDAHPED